MSGSGQRPEPVVPPSEDELASLVAGARARGGSPGRSYEIEPPPSLAERLARAPVQAVQLTDGRVAILLKTAVGWKDNFQGFLIVAGGLLPSELKGDAKGRRYVSLPAPPPWEELYVNRALTDQLWEVYFDLN